MPPRRVAVAGGGVGGLAAARLLSAVAKDTRVTVYAAGRPPEASPAHARPPPADRAIGVWPGARKALEDMDVWERLRRVATDLPPAAYRNGGGTWLSRAPADAPERVAAMRESDVRSALVPAGPNVDVRWHQRVVRVTDGAVVHVVADGEDDEAARADGGEYDVVVGADGALSAVRAATGASPAVPTGTVSASGWLAADDVKLLCPGDDTPPYEVLASGRRLAYVPAGGHGAASFFATMPRDALPASRRTAADVGELYREVFDPVPLFLAHPCVLAAWWGSRSVNQEHLQESRALQSSFGEQFI